RGARRATRRSRRAGGTRPSSPRDRHRRAFRTRARAFRHTRPARRASSGAGLRRRAGPSRTDPVAAPSDVSGYRALQRRRPDLPEVSVEPFRVHRILGAFTRAALLELAHAAEETYAVGLQLGAVVVRVRQLERVALRCIP